MQCYSREKNDKHLTPANDDACVSNFRRLCEEIGQHKKIKHYVAYLLADFVEFFVRCVVATNSKPIISAG
jgi:hypothetical protein